MLKTKILEDLIRVMKIKIVKILNPVLFYVEGRAEEWVVIRDL